MNQETVSKYEEKALRNQRIQRKILDLAHGREAMTAGEILLAVNLGYQIFGKFVVRRRTAGAVKGGGKFFSQTCDVYRRLESGWDGEAVSPKAGWRVEQAARYLAVATAPENAQ